MGEHPIDVTKKVFELFGTGDVKGIQLMLDDNVIIEFYGPDTIPYAGIYHGVDACGGFFDTVLSSVEIHQFEPQQFMSDGNMVTVTGHLHLTALSTGKDFQSDFVHVITVRDGKWLRFRDFMDTALAVEGFTP